MNDTENLSMRDRVAMLRLPAAGSAAESRSRALWLPWTLCLLSAFAASSMFLRTRSLPTAGVGPGNPPSAPASRTAAADSPGTQAATPPTTMPAGSTVLESKGYIIPAHQIQISPIEVSGRILDLRIEEGKRFNEGEILAILDSSSYDAQFHEANANLLAAQARLAELRNGSRPEEIRLAEAELREAEETLKQAKLKYERNLNLKSGVLSAEEFEQAQYAYTSLTQRIAKLQTTLELTRIGPRQERIDAATAEVKLAEARLRRAKWLLDNCTIRAPVSGTILKKNAEIGGLVSPLSFNVASSICDMADLSDLEVDLEIPERDIAKVAVGMPCRISTDAYPTRMYEGIVDRIMPVALQNKAAVQVRVKVNIPENEEQGKFLKPGMNARVTFLQPANN